MSTVRTAACRCGQLRAVCTGDPVRVSVCHCLECQKRSGSSFAAQARWPNGQVEITGEATAYTRTGDSGERCVFRFCPACGCTIAYVHEAMADLTAIPIGAFADPAFPAPHYSVYEGRKHAWVTITGEGVEHYE